MFYYADDFNQCLNNWTVDKVTNKTDLFKDAESFEKKNANWYYQLDIIN